MKFNDLWSFNMQKNEWLQIKTINNPEVDFLNLVFILQNSQEVGHNWLIIITN